MPSIIDQLTEIYVFIDDHLKQHPEKAQWRGSNNAEPDFSDPEVLTIGLSERLRCSEFERDLSEDSGQSSRGLSASANLQAMARPFTRVESPGQRPAGRQHCIVERSAKTLLD
jgi:hypothetical protein